MRFTPDSATAVSRNDGDVVKIDEGFGSQDQEGCDRLIGAINAIAPDFSCVLAVTHVPHFREAFQTRIDVVKTPDGSSLCLSA